MDSALEVVMGEIGLDLVSINLFKQICQTLGQANGTGIVAYP